MTAIVGEVNTRYYQMCAQWHALKLEGIGLKRSGGRSLKAALAQHYGLPARTAISRVQSEHVKRVREYAATHNLPLPRWAQ